MLSECSQLNGSEEALRQGSDVTGSLSAYAFPTLSYWFRDPFSVFWCLTLLFHLIKILKLISIPPLLSILILSRRSLNKSLVFPIWFLKFWVSNLYNGVYINTECISIAPVTLCRRYLNEVFGEFCRRLRCVNLCTQLSRWVLMCMLVSVRMWMCAWCWCMYACMSMWVCMLVSMLACVCPCTCECVARRLCMSFLLRVLGCQKCFWVGAVMISECDKVSPKKYGPPLFPLFLRQSMSKLSLPIPDWARCYVLKKHIQIPLFQHRQQLVWRCSRRHWLPPLAVQYGEYILPVQEKRVVIL